MGSEKGNNIWMIDSHVQGIVLATLRTLSLIPEQTQVIPLCEFGENVAHRYLWSFPKLLTSVVGRCRV